eukprot:5725445-Pyramimonas_sp.AAC.1
MQNCRSCARPNVRICKTIEIYPGKNIKVKRENPDTTVREITGAHVGPSAYDCDCERAACCVPRCDALDRLRNIKRDMMST